MWSKPLHEHLICTQNLQQTKKHIKHAQRWSNVNQAIIHVIMAQTNMIPFLQTF